MAFRLLQALPAQYEDANGNPLVGGTLEFYLWNTTTPAALYTDSSGTSLGTSCTLNSLGLPQTSGGTACQLFGDTTITGGYKIIRKDAAGATISPTLGPIYTDIGGVSGVLDIINGRFPKTAFAESFAAVKSGTYTDYRYVFMLSYTADQGKGAVLLMLDGTSGAASSGNHPGTCYDAAGNGITIAYGQPLNSYQFGCLINGATNDVTNFGYALAFSIARQDYLNQPSGTMIINGTGTFGLDSVIAKLRGAGSGVSIITSTNAAGTYVMEFLTTTSGNIEGGELSGVTINARSGFRINEASPDETDILNTKTIQRFKMDDVILNGIDFTGIPLQMHKCFNFVPTRVYVKSGDLGLWARGSDLLKIMGGNKFEQNRSAHIRADGLGSFGSQFTVQDADILALSSGAGTSSTGNIKCMIMSDADTIKIDRCLLEQYENPTNNLDAVLYLKKSLGSRINKIFVRENNVIGVSYMTKFLHIDSQDGSSNNDVTWLEVHNNETLNGHLPASTIAGNILYYQNGQRTTIHVDDYGSFGELPWTTEQPIMDSVDSCIFNVARSGLTGADYGSLVRIEQGSFRLPPIAAAGSLITLDPKQNGFASSFDGHTNGVSLFVLAKASVNATVLSWNLVDSGGTFNGGTQALTTEWKYYSLASATGSVANTDIRAQFYNQDTVNNGNIFLKVVRVQQAP